MHNNVGGLYKTYFCLRINILMLYVYSSAIFHGKYAKESKKIDKWKSYTSIRLLAEVNFHVVFAWATLKVEQKNALPITRLQSFIVGIGQGKIDVLLVMHIWN